MCKNYLFSRWKLTRLFLFGTCFGTLFGTPAYSQTSNLSVAVGVEAWMVINTPTSSLVSSATFADYTGLTSFTYRIRTSQSAGTGAIQLQITSDFSPTGGPSISSPLSSGDKLTYTCTVSSPGTGCSGAQTSTTSSQTSVATFGADAHTATGGSNGSVGWDLTNDPEFKTGTYIAIATFTISAT